MARRTRDSRAYDKFAATVDVPLLVLAVVMIPLLIAPLIWHLRPAASRAIDGLDWFIWAAFAFEYTVKLYLTPNRRHFIRTHIPDLIVVLVPLLRPAPPGTVATLDFCLFRQNGEQVLVQVVGEVKKVEPGCYLVEIRSNARILRRPEIFA